jgi:rieske iron-sulfur protein
LSDNQNDVEKKEDASSSQDNSTSDSNQKKEQPKPAAKPTIGTPINRPRIGTPIGTPKSTTSTPPTTPAPAAQVPSKPAPAGSAVQRPTIGTPVGTRPTIGTPVGAKPAVGTPAGAKPSAPVGTAAPAAAPRPVISSPPGAKSVTPVKKPESKQDISRRNFMRGIVALGGIVALIQFAPLFPYLQGSVGSTTRGTQKITDSLTGAPVTASTFDDPTHTDWVTFVYPSTGNTNIDSDTFRQCVAIRLPKGFTAPSNLSVKDSNGNIYVGFSRVCVHLWCLWSYVVADSRMECPCHGSQYVPGSGNYPLLPTADNQPPGLAVEGPASLQTPPNNMLPIITLQINSDGTFSATGVIGQIGCGQDC